MKDHPEDFPSPHDPNIIESLTSSEKSGGKVTNEDLQVTIMKVLKSMKKISLETRGEVSSLCSLTRTLQRKLDLECSTPKDGYASEGVVETSPKKELVVPQFPLLEELKNKGKKKKGAEISHQEDPQCRVSRDKLA